MDETNLIQNSDPSLEEDVFRDTRPIPIAERERKQVAKKRMFFVLLGLCLIVVGLIVWEVVSMVVGAAK